MQKQPKLTELFNQWLTTNSDKFEYPPVKVEKNRYRFEGIIENIYLVLDDEDLSSHIVIDKLDGSDCGNIYLDGVMTPCEDDKGFYDSWEKEDITYYSSYEELIYKEAFIYIIEYCDKHFSPDASLYFVDNLCQSHIICPNKDKEDDSCEQLQRVIDKGTYLGTKKPKESMGVAKIIKYDLCDNTNSQTSYIRDERATELLFEKWLEKNSERFKYKPLRKNDNEYYFEGIIKNISLHIVCEECYLGFDDNDGECVDYIDIEYIEQSGYKKDKGYYDEGTTEYYIEKNLPIPYFKTYEQMIEKTLFETLVNYCDKKFIRDNRLYLSTSGGGSYATIKSSDWGEDDDWNVVKLEIIDFK
jgi:hypothetical protein